MYGLSAEQGRLCLVTALSGSYFSDTFDVA